MLHLSMSHSHATASAIRPLSRALKQVHPHAIRLHRVLSDECWRQSVGDLARNMTVGLEPYEVPHGFELRLQGEAGVFGVELSRADFPMLAFACTIEESDRRDAAARILIDEALELLARAGWPVRHVSLRPALQPAEWEARLAVHWGAQTGNVLLPSECDRLITVLEDRLASHADKAGISTLDVVVEGRLRLGSQRVQTSTLRALRCGDVLVGALAHLGRPAAGTVELLFTGAHGRVYSLRCRLEERQITIEEEYRATSVDPPDVEVPHGDLDDGGQVAGELSDLQLKVQVEIAAPRMKISQISSLAVGQVIALGRPVRTAPVVLRICDQVWARGELVAVGDQLGVRITVKGGAHVLSE